MSCHPRVPAWTLTSQAHMPHVSNPQAPVLALWSLGMVLARSGALTVVRAFWATWLQRQEPTVRQQFREWCYEATAQRGPPRCALAVESCFVPLWAWVVDQGEGTPLALVLEATMLGTRWPVLAISVVYRGCAIPVAWTVLPATATHAWCRAPGPSSSWPIGACMPGGCFGASPGWGGTRFYASTLGALSVLRARCAGSP